ncbi:rab proteins geranylgeranyltransferase component A [Tetranychus urticae]|uniref:Rab proteins geranylgeranyltransferase component A n=1 Tax=Tetranychus urticae TaxID=32264 RepID=T1KNE0_TETUR|nr:rab proteins geranylgeranyltransferase component A [Tetranychus urticae]
MEPGFEDEYDLVVIGTGLTESIVATACSRIGKKVLHLDPNDYYGDLWTSFTFPQLDDWARRHVQLAGGKNLPDNGSQHQQQQQFQSQHNHDQNNPSEKVNNQTSNIGISLSKVNLTAGEMVYPWESGINLISNVEPVSYMINEAPEKQDLDKATEEEEEDVEEADDETEPWTFEKLSTERNWGIDLVPRLLYSRGAMVNLLVSSNICRYLSFRSIERILSCLPGTDELMDVPCTRQDIFNDSYTSLIEKRVLMRFIQLCLELERRPDLIEGFEGFEEQPFIEYLRSKGFTPLLQHLVLNSIAMVDPTTPTQEAMEQLKRFVSSSGRFGNTPFLFPFYGCGEIPQAFCRLCAVFGGTYCLKRTIDGVVAKDDVINSIIVGSQQIKCQNLVCSLSNVPKSLLVPRQVTNISRAIFISSGSVKDSQCAGSLLRFPGPFPILVVESSWASLIAPKGIFVIYAWCDSFTGNAKEDLLPIARKLFNFESGDEMNGKPKLLWSCFYNQATVDCSSITDKYQNLYVTSPPVNELDYDVAIEEAKSIFDTLLPDEEFLPRAPDHDEIVIEGTQTNQEIDLD